VGTETHWGDSGNVSSLSIQRRTMLAVTLYRGNLDATLFKGLLLIGSCIDYLGGLREGDHKVG